MLFLKIVEKPNHLIPQLRMLLQPRIKLTTQRARSENENELLVVPFAAHAL
ncbi:hypothetical protein D3C85_1819080 [compost metagenome]